MRLRGRVLLIALTLSLVFASGLAFAVLKISFENSLDAELDRGAHNSGMLAASLRTGIEAFSHLPQEDAPRRAIRLTASYMTEPALITVTSPEGLLLHDNFPLDKAALLRHIPREPGQYRLARYLGEPWQLIRRSILTSQGVFQLGAGGFCLQQLHLGGLVLRFGLRHISHRGHARLLAVARQLPAALVGLQRFTQDLDVGLCRTQ